MTKRVTYNDMTLLLIYRDMPGLGSSMRVYLSSSDRFRTAYKFVIDSDEYQLISL